MDGMGKSKREGAGGWARNKVWTRSGRDSAGRRDDTYYVLLVLVTFGTAHKPAGTFPASNFQPSTEQARSSIRTANLQPSADPQHLYWPAKLHRWRRAPPDGQCPTVSRRIDTRKLPAPGLRF
ncbi:hypothetical protein CMUS01_06533 [Colletotrichum musicola]|uniref:Uncharacterized protein n=1 Tax=Colletotrichum musicola TaxID=2175873 RepID=A0A8H6KL14_9PEZI|nr:hypothetical protein CMUS01_06533 [Colletotrichum musicola]